MAVDPDVTILHALRFRANRRDFQDRLAVVRKIQADLGDEVERLTAVERWDEVVTRGIGVWAQDRDNIFRFLKVSIGRKLSCSD
jgi:hypothetical protein